MGQKYQVPPPLRDTGSPLKDSPPPPLKFQKSSAPGKYTIQNSPAPIKSGGVHTLKSDGGLGRHFALQSPNTSG